MKNLKKQVEFSKILDLNKEDVANLNERDMNDIWGGGVSNDCATAGCDGTTWTYTGCTCQCSPGKP